jgi:hypothetical protein
MRRRRFTTEEDDAIRRYAGTMTPAQIGRMLGRGTSSIANRAKILGVWAPDVDKYHHHVTEPYEFRKIWLGRRNPPPLPVGGSTFIRPLTRAELMAGRAR